MTPDRLGREIMALLVAAIIGGIILGGVYALIALGMVLAFRATQTFNFAHGELMLLPAFLVGFLEGDDFTFAISFLIAVSLSALTGALFYLLVLRRTTGLPVFMGVIATFGLATILDGIMGILFGSDQYQIAVPELPTGSIRIFGASISKSSLILGVFAILLAVLVAVIVRWTHVGKMIRAAGQDAVLASQCGINVRRVYVGSWVLAAVLAAIAGIAYGNIASVDSSITAIGLVAIPAIVIGGMDSVEGAIAGGVIIGIIQGFAQIYLGGQYVDAVTYGALLIILLLWPQGLFGTKQVVRA